MASIAPATSQLTAEQFEVKYADVPFCELERGEVVHLTAGGWHHSRISFRIARLLGEWAERTGSGRVLINEAGVVTQRSPDTVRGIDVAYFSYQRVPNGAEPSGIAMVAPELAVEVVGKGQGWGKMVEKAAEYLRMGTSSVWIVSPKSTSVHIFRADADPEKFTDTDALTDPEVLPGFSCSVRDIFND